MIELPQIQELQASQELQELQASLVLQGLHAGNLLRESRSHLEDTTPKEKNSVRRKVDDFLKSKFSEFSFEELAKESLYKAVEESIKIGKDLSGFRETEEVKVATSPDEMLDYFELRHKAYERLNYIQNFPSPIPYIEFDKFDQYSLVLVRKEEGKPIGYIRIILDNPQGIMSERFYDFRDIRRDTKDTKMAELSRIVVDKNRTNNKKTSLALFEKVPEACKCLGIESLIGAMQTSQRWRYDEFGDTETLIEGFMYGNIPGDSSLINWMI